MLFGGQKRCFGDAEKRGFSMKSGGFDGLMWRFGCTESGSFGACKVADWVVGSGGFGRGVLRNGASEGVSTPQECSIQGGGKWARF